MLNRNKKPTKLVKVTFNCYPAPLTLKGETNYEVNPCKVPYLRCNFCQKHGHSTKDCRADKQKCPLCALEHSYSDCPSRGNKRAYTCGNCGLNHGAAFLNCTIFQQYKKQVDAQNERTRQAWNERRHGEKAVQNIAQAISQKRIGGMPLKDLISQPKATQSKQAPSLPKPKNQVSQPKPIMCTVSIDLPPQPTLHLSTQRKML